MLILFQHRRYPFYSDTTDAHYVPTPRLPVLFRHLRSSFYLTLQMLILFCHPRCLFFYTGDTHSILTPWMLILFQHHGCLSYIFQHRGCLFYSKTTDARGILTLTMLFICITTPRMLFLLRHRGYLFYSDKTAGSKATRWL